MNSAAETSMPRAVYLAHEALLSLVEERGMGLSRIWRYRGAQRMVHGKMARKRGIESNT